MLVATIIVVWRSRPAAVAARAAKQRQRRRTLALEANAKRITRLPFELPASSASAGIAENKEGGDTSVLSASTAGSDTDAPSLSSPPPKTIMPHVSHSVASTLDIILAPQLLKCAEEGEGPDEEEILEKPPPAVLGDLPSSSASAWWFM